MTITKTLQIKQTPRTYQINIIVSDGNSDRMNEKRTIATFSRVDMAGTAAMAMASTVNSLQQWMSVDSITFVGDQEGLDFLKSLDLIQDDPQDDWNSVSSRHHY